MWSSRLHRADALEEWRGAREGGLGSPALRALQAWGCPLAGGGSRGVAASRHAPVGGSGPGGVAAL